MPGSGVVAIVPPTDLVLPKLPTLTWTDGDALVVRGGLKPGETKKIHGKLYIVPADVAKLALRYEKDFPKK